MPRCVPPDLQRTRCCSIRLHASEEAQLRAAAAQRGRQFGPFLRDLVLFNLDIAAPPPPVAPGVPRAVLAALHELQSSVLAGYEALDRAYRVISLRRNLARSREHVAGLLRQVADHARHQHAAAAEIIRLASPSVEAVGAS